ncbi:MAG: SLBB domain-containing protein [Bacteroidales bacterium]|nr:SLBB domain-containing protein [Bacteroidales bacterium]
MKSAVNIKKVLIMCAITLLSFSGFTQNVDVLRNLARQVQAGDISRQEALQKAREAGVSQEQFEQARQQYSRTGEIDISDLDRSMAPSFDVREDTLPQTRRDTGDTSRLRRVERERDTADYYFGYEMFEGPEDKFKSADIGAVDPNYQIGPGDELVLSIWGATEMRSKMQVSRDGTVFIERYGQMNVSGLTLDQLEKKLIKNLSRIYSGLSPDQGNPTTHLDISLGKLRSIQIYVAGKVKNPGSRFVSNYSTAFTALYNAGGPTIHGSMRKVQVIRNGEVISSLDLYDFVTSGKKPDDVRLQNQDVVYVPPRLSTIKLKGDVKDTAFYELKKEETLRDLLEFSGGLRTSADIQKVQIERISSFTDRERSGEYYKVMTPDLGTFQQDTFQVNPIPIHDKDVVTISPITGKRIKDSIPGGVNYVQVSGHVYKPGRYVLGEDMKLKDLLTRAGGLKDSVFWDQTYQLRADLIRYTGNEMDRKIIPVPLNKLIEGDAPQHNHALKHRDSLIVYSADVVHEEKVTSIYGEVENPGDYQLEENMNVHDLLLQAGGFTKRAYKYNLEVFRLVADEGSDQLTSVHNVEISPDMLKQFEAEEAFDLEDYDMVIVRRDPDLEYHRVVKIAGEVQYPGRYPILNKNETLGTLIERAGGLTNEAFIRGAEFIRNDSARIVGDFAEAMEKEQQSIVLQQGDSITIPQQPGTVRIRGAVRNPGHVQYRPGWRADRYVEAAGDYTFDAAKAKTIVYYPGGNARRKRWLWNPPVEEGSEIFVPEKPPREPLDITELLSQWASIATSVATVIYIINRN